MRAYFIWAIIVLGILAVVFSVWARSLHKEYANAAIGVTVGLEVIIIAILILVLLWAKRKKKD